VHHEVTHIDDEPSLCKIISEDIVHECLEDRQRIALVKEHHHRLIKPVRSSEKSFLGTIFLFFKFPSMNIFKAFIYG